METTNDAQQFVKLRDESGRAHFCPLDAVFSKESDWTDCVGEDVVQRYAGNLIVT